MLPPCGARRVPLPHPLLEGMACQLPMMGSAAAAAPPPPRSPPGAAVCRRSLLAAAVGPLLAAGAAPPAAYATALPPFTQRSLLETFFPAAPVPVPVPRRTLTPLPFAVLLLRSGYDAADSLDFVPMNDFQRDFWLMRRDAWQPYTLQYSPLPIEQGNIASPEYFDFIAGMQAATVSAAMAAGRQVFSELCDVETNPGCADGKRLVTRDPALQDNAALPREWQRRTGDNIYVGLRADGPGFRGATFAGPPPAAPGAGSAELLAGVEGLLRVFADAGYALKAGVVERDAAAGSFTVRCEGPASLWALQLLAAQGAAVHTAYPEMAIDAYLRASGREAAYDLSWSDAAVESRWRLGGGG